MSSLASRNRPFGIRQQSEPVEIGRLAFVLNESVAYYDSRRTKGEFVRSPANPAFRPKLDRDSLYDCLAARVIEWVWVSVDSPSSFRCVIAPPRKGATSRMFGNPVGKQFSPVRSPSVLHGGVRFGGCGNVAEIVAAKVRVAEKQLHYMPLSEF